MIELRDITVSLPREGADAVTILDRVNLTIQEGEWIHLVGPNGSGKTTLLKAIAQLIPHVDGEIRVHRKQEGDIRIALLLQEPDNQFVASSVRWELVLSLPSDMTDADGERRMVDAIDRFALGDFLDRNPHRLSGGEKQRLAFATVWLSDPELLLLDEPTSYLDRVQSERFVQFVRELHASGATIVWAAPDAGTRTAASRVVCMDHGRLVDAPAVLEPLDTPLRHRAPPAHPPEKSDHSSVICMRSAFFAYETRVVFEDLSLDVFEGECVAVTGLNGAGKSTLLDVMGGVIEPKGGSIDRRYARAVENGRQNVFYLFQSPETLFFTETVDEELGFGLRAMKTPKAEIRSRVDDALMRVGLPPEAFRSRLPHSLSFGEMRRVAFAITLALDPQLLLMDEPASCLDAFGRSLLVDLLGYFKARGRTVVVAAHDTRPFAPVIDRVIELRAR